MHDLKLSDSRLRFKLRAAMCPTVKMHFQSDTKFAKELWSCWDCEDYQIDSLAHIQRCSVYADLRHDLDLEEDQDLVTFFRRVIEKRKDST